jgi:CheY-like chemotaxis protein
MPSAVVTQRPRVLLVDDEPSIRAVYPEVLGGDYEVSVAESGRAALDLLQRDRDFEAIICDLTMPDIDGPAFYVRLQALAPQLLGRLVFCSGGLITARLREFAASIPNLFLEKPIRVETLCAAIERVRKV